MSASISSISDFIKHVLGFSWETLLKHELHDHEDIMEDYIAAGEKALPKITNHKLGKDIELLEDLFYQDRPILRRKYLEYDNLLYYMSLFFLVKSNKLILSLEKIQTFIDNFIEDWFHYSLCLIGGRERIFGPFSCLAGDFSLFILAIAWLCVYLPEKFIVAPIVEIISRFMILPLAKTLLTITTIVTWITAKTNLTSIATVATGFLVLSNMNFLHLGFLSASTPYLKIAAFSALASIPHVAAVVVGVVVTVAIVATLWYLAYKAYKHFSSKKVKPLKNSNSPQSKLSILSNHKQPSSKSATKLQYQIDIHSENTDGSNLSTDSSRC